MKINLFNTKQEKLMEKALDVYVKQNKAIAQNVANAGNPDYKRINTDFSQVLKSASSQSKLKVTNKRHISSSGLIGNINFDEKRGGGGKVNITKEMADLAENQIRHELVTQTLNRYYNALKTSISGKIR
ncbi:MAG: flagellar basal body rod protein FlgB [Candidatus Neomarinimicrobiota bacterium]|nr:MAG: flagellar basal body rod protein FlgB [Candidatus Neomarinimicrobiota bacterium]